MKTILHIEPSAFFVEVIRKKFNDSEYEYLSTDSYNEALILLEEFDVDLIISSFEGNGMTCEEFIKNVTYSYQDIPVCILSGNKLNSNMQQFMNLGVIQYIDKEEVNEALIKYIDNIFKMDKYLQILKEKEEIVTLPIEQYKIDWKNSADKDITARTIPIKSIFIKDSTINTNNIDISKTTTLV